jgi:short-subunit dehydrogenase
MVTGAADGIGLETARQYVAEGARVLLVSRGIQKLRAATDSLGQSVELAAVDLTNRAAIESFLRDLDARGYTPDVLVNNAGQGLSGPFADSDWSEVASMLDLNMIALARLTHWAAGRMKAVGRGAIVNLSAAVATRPVPWFAAYAASKAFVSNLSQALDYELKPHGVRVSAIHPPAVRTSFADAGKADLRSTLVLKLFPTVGAATVARAVRSAARRHRRSVIIGPVAAIVMGTAPITPRAIDLSFMSMLFKARRPHRSRSRTLPEYEKPHLSLTGLSRPMGPQTISTEPDRHTNS